MSIEPDPTVQPGDDEHESDEFCPACHARQVALDLLELAVFNCLAAGAAPQEIYDQLTATLDGLTEIGAGDLDENTPTVGQA